MLPTETKQLLAGPASYNISNSLRFRASASAYLNRTPTVAGNRKTWTWSGWIKRGTLGSAIYPTIFMGGATLSDTGATNIAFGGDTITVQGYSTNWVVTSQVFRDPSAFYHIVIAFDTTQSTAANRLRIYVNGVQVTAFSTDNRASLTLNGDYGINQAALHTIGYQSAAFGAGYFDGYMTEINFLDGYPTVGGTTYTAGTWASLNVATLFGFYDPYTGVWMPQRYTGTYTGTSFYTPFINQSSSTFAATFNGSTQYLVTNSVGNALALSNSDFTLEYWMNTTTAVSGATLCCAGSGTVSYDGLFGYITAGTLVTYLSSTGGSWDIASNRTVISSIVTGRWYHIAYTRSGSTWRVFVDGTQVDTFTSSASLYQSSNQFSLARAQGTGYFTGLLSNVRVVKGTALYTSNFTPPIQPLTAVTNTQLLTLQSSTVIDNSANAFSILNNGSVTMSAATPFTQPDLTADYSGLGNNWTPNNISLTAGATYDSMIDVPTNWPDGGNGRGNYCVLNPLTRLLSGYTLAAGNLDVTNPTAGSVGCTGTFSVSYGKWYFEATVGSVPNATYVGIGNSEQSGRYLYLQSGNKYSDAGGSVAYGATFTTGDRIGVAFDLDNGTIVFYKNGATQGTAFTGLSGSFFPVWVTNGTVSTAWNFNFGQRPFFYSNYGTDRPAATFLALNTQNLVTPTILNGARYMAATTYNGNSTIQNVSNQTNSNNPLQIAMQPDFVWIKSRSGAQDHILNDSVRGAGNYLVSNSTAIETTNTIIFSAFNPNGFQLNNAAQTNTTGQTYVGWQWQAGTAPTTNNVAGAGNVPTAGSVKINGADSTSALAGSIAATRISANQTAGFSVVTYTCPASGAYTVAHGLGVTPSMIILKDRSVVTAWPTYHRSISTTTALYLNLNTTAATLSAAGIWGAALPTTTVFGNTPNLGVAANSNVVAYCFAEVAGYSAFGSYTGNGSTDGPFVYTGFRPRFILLKRSSGVENWQIYDTSRDTYNVAGLQLLPNTSGAEADGRPILDILSNGFKLRNSTGGGNAAADYIYAAFAENPFKVSRAR